MGWEVQDTFCCFAFAVICVEACTLKNNSEIYYTSPYHAKALMMMMMLERCKCIAQMPYRRCGEIQVT